MNNEKTIKEETYIKEEIKAIIEKYGEFTSEGGIYWENEVAIWDENLEGWGIISMHPLEAISNEILKLINYKKYKIMENQGISPLPIKAMEQTKENEDNQSSTLSPQKVIKIEGEIKTMDFPEAIRAIIEGKKITKLEWNDKKIYGVLNDNILMLHKRDGVMYKWMLSDGDLLGEDWIVVGEDKNEDTRSSTLSPKVVLNN